MNKHNKNTEKKNNGNGNNNKQKQQKFGKESEVLGSEYWRFL